MKRIWLKLQYWMLMYLLRRHREFETISSVGPPDGKYDTYWVFVLEDRTDRNSKEDGQAERRYKYMVKHSSQGHLLAQQTRESDSVPPYPRFKIDSDFFAEKTLDLQHYYRDTSFVYGSVLRCFLDRCFGVYWLKWAWRALLEVILQRTYAKRFKVVTDRIKILQEVIKLNDEGFAEPGVVTVASRIHGKRFILMESSDKTLAMVRRLLDSLVADGYLQRAEQGYRATGQSMAALLQLQGEARSERLARFSQFMMVILTLILAVSSAFVTWFTYLGLENKPF